VVCREGDRRASAQDEQLRPFWLRLTRISKKTYGKSEEALVVRSPRQRHQGSDPEQAAMEAAQRKRLLHAIRRLPPAKREALLLVAGDGRKMHEAAAISRISVSALKMHLFRARRRLALMMDDTHGR
jgi:RNA polymerase sigma factor (sigma-70 family)